MASRRPLFILLMAAAVLIGGCSTAPQRPLPVDLSNPVKRLAILPFKNDTSDVEGPAIVRGKMARALANRSYAVQDLKETEQVLRDRMGINLGGQLDLTTPQKLGETLGVDAVLYGTLMDFSELNTGLINVKKVRAKFKLVLAGTGQTFWQRGLGVKSEIIMGTKAGLAAVAATRLADPRDQEAPWVVLESVVHNQDFTTSLVFGLGSQLLTSAVGLHLDREAAELARRVTDNVPWGPGRGMPSAPKPPPAAELPADAAPPGPGTAAH